MSGPEESRNLAFRSINSKRLDFLVIDRIGLPALAVEYQGHGHYQNGAFMRDAVKREAVRKANIRSWRLRPSTTQPSWRIVSARRYDATSSDRFIANNSDSRVVLGNPGIPAIGPRNGVVERRVCIC